MHRYVSMKFSKTILLSHLDRLLYSVEGDSLEKACSYSKAVLLIAALVI